MGIKWNSPEFWAAMKWDHAAVDKNGHVFSYYAKPIKADGEWTEVSDFYGLGALGLVGLPDNWEESRICRPAVRGSQAYWDDAPDWAQWVVITPSGYEYWLASEPNLVSNVLGWKFLDTHICSRKNQPTDDWQNSKIERPYVWQLPDESTLVDTPCWRRGFPDDPWKKANIAGKHSYWADGRSEWTGNCRRYGREIVLADRNNLTRVPPMDLKLGLKT